jgi:hypothetical protein
METEPLSVIIKLDASRELIEGFWYKTPPFGLEENKFTDDGYSERFEEYRFDTDGRFYDYGMGPADTQWLLENGR